MVYKVYVDGSYKKVPTYGEFYGSGVVITDDNNNTIAEHCFVGNDKAVISSHNVTGEVRACMLAMEYCMNTLHVTQDDTLIIHYDYHGIHNWLKSPGEKDYWKAKSPLSQAYKEYMNTRVKTRVKLEFVWTPGHTGIFGNERADALARRAIEDAVWSLRQSDLNP